MTNELTDAEREMLAILEAITADIAVIKVDLKETLATMDRIHQDCDNYEQKRATGGEGMSNRIVNQILALSAGTLKPAAMRKITRMTPLPGYRLHVEFDDGVAGTVDLEPELSGPVFTQLRDETLFAQVRIDECGAPSWPNGADLAPDGIYAGLASQRIPADKSPGRHSGSDDRGTDGSLIGSLEKLKGWVLRGFGKRRRSANRIVI